MGKRAHGVPNLGKEGAHVTSRLVFTWHWGKPVNLQRAETLRRPGNCGLWSAREMARTTRRWPFKHAWIEGKKEGRSTAEELGDARCPGRV